MGNLPGNHRRRGFGHGHGRFEDQNTGPFGGPSPDPFGGPNTGPFANPSPGPFGGQNAGPVGPQITGQISGPQGRGPYAPPYNLGQGNYPPQGYPPQGHPPQGYHPQGYPQQGYLPQGYPPQGYPPQGYPQGQMYPGYGPGYPQQGYPGGQYQRPVSPGAGMGQAACCGSLIACLTSLLCSCSPCLMGGGGTSDTVADDGNEAPGTANVSSPHNDDDH